MILIKRRLIKYIAFAAAAVITASLGIAALWTASRSYFPSEPGGSDEITMISAGQSGESWYSGTISGTLNRHDYGGNVTKSAKLSDYALSFVRQTDDGVIVADQSPGKRMFVLDEEMNVLQSLDLYSSVYDIVSSGGFYFVFAQVTQNLYIEKYDSALNRVAGGRLNYYDEYDDEMVPVIIRTTSVSVAKDGSSIYVTGDGSQLIKLPGDMLSLTESKEQFRASGQQSVFLDYGYVRAAAYDEQRDKLYIATSQLSVVAVDGGLLTEEFICKIPNAPSALAYAKDADKLFAAYELYSDISLININKGTAEQLSGAFKIRTLGASPDASILLSLSREQSSNLVQLSDVSKMIEQKLLSKITAVCTVMFFAGVAGISVYAFLLFAKESLRQKALSALTRGAKGIWKQRGIYLIFLPSLTLLFTFCYYPAVSSLILGFFDYRMGSPKIFTGFSNYAALFANSTFILSIRNMAIFLASDILTALIPPVFFALCLTILRNKTLSKWIRILLYMPAAVPGVVSLLVWSSGIYGDHGLLNSIIRAAGGETVAFLGDRRLSVASIIMTGFPFIGSYLIFYGALMNLPQSYYEFAELEGCSFFKRVLKVDLPLISAQLKYVFVLSVIMSVQNVGRVMMTTQGAAGSQIPIYMMYNYLTDNDYGLSSAIATLMFLVLFAATLLNLKIQTAETESGA